MSNWSYRKRLGYFYSQGVAYKDYWQSLLGRNNISIDAMSLKRLILESLQLVEAETISDDTPLADIPVNDVGLQTLIDWLGTDIRAKEKVETSPEERRTSIDRSDFIRLFEAFEHQGKFDPNTLNALHSILLPIIEHPAFVNTFLAADIDINSCEYSIRKSKTAKNIAVIDVPGVGGKYVIEYDGQYVIPKSDISGWFGSDLKNTSFPALITKFEEQLKSKFPKCKTWIKKNY